MGPPIGSEDSTSTQATTSTVSPDATTEELPTLFPDGESEIETKDATTRDPKKDAVSTSTTGTESTEPTEGTALPPLVDTDTKDIQGTTEMSTTATTAMPGTDDVTTEAPTKIK